jgi:hypothetical protein
MRAGGVKGEGGRGGASEAMVDERRAALSSKREERVGVRSRKGGVEGRERVLSSVGE